MSEHTAEIDAVDQFITDAMNRGIIPMHVAADLSQYLVVEWSEARTTPPGDDHGGAGVSEREALARALNPALGGVIPLDWSVVEGSEFLLLVADAALAHIAAVLRDEVTVEAVADHIAGERDRYPRLPDDMDSGELAASVLTYLAERLGVPHE